MHHQFLRGFPAVEGVGVMRQQMQQFCFIVFIHRKPHRRGELAQQRGNRLAFNLREGEGLLGLGYHQYALQRCGCALVFFAQAQGNRLSVGVDQPHAHGNQERLFLGLAGGRWTLLAEGQGVGLGIRVVGAGGGDLGCARLAVPALEYVQMLRQRRSGVGVGHGLGKIVARDGLAIVALEIQVHARAEALSPHQGLDHAHHFRAFFVHGAGVEVADFLVLVGPNRVGHGAAVFAELDAAQVVHDIDAAHRASAGCGGQVFTEFLVAKHGEALFETQLEPVAAGDPVACPVVEVFMSDDTFDSVVVFVGRGGGIGQHVFGVEDVQTFVFHGSGIEIAHRHDHEALQVKRQAETALIPGQTVDQRLHGVPGLVQVASAHEYLQQVLLARPAGDGLFTRHQFSGHQGEEVAGLFEWIVPDGKMAAVVQFALFHQVAVGQQHRIQPLVAPQRHAVSSHDVRPVEEIGDAAEALGLALREETALAHEQALQLGVLFGGAGGENFELERLGAFRQVLQHQLVTLHPERGALAVDQHTRQVQLHAIEFEWLRCHIRVAAQCHPVEHACLGRVQVKREVHRVDPECGRCIVLAVGRGGGGGGFAEHRVNLRSNAALLHRAQ